MKAFPASMFVILPLKILVHALFAQNEMRNKTIFSHILHFVLQMITRTNFERLFSSVFTRVFFSRVDLYLQTVWVVEDEILSSLCPVLNHTSRKEFTHRI